MRLVPVPGVFRPISDSWLLARVVKDEVARRPDPPSVLDICTGSGVVGVTAARAGADVTAVDVSCRAVAAAWLNARINHVRVDSRRGDLLDPVKDQRFDVIASNPPYVPSDHAWVAGPDGRALLDRLIAEAPTRLRPGGALLLVHSALIGAEETLDRLAAAGLKADVAVSEDDVLVLRGRRA